MTQELKYLTVEMIDALLESIGRRPGIIAESEYYTPRGCCAMGALGYDAQGEYSTSLRRKRAENLGIRTEHILFGPERLISFESESFVGTPQERKAHMLNYLREQRDLKCCDWVPAPKEKVPVKSTADAVVMELNGK